MTGRLDGKVAIVTGAGSGIGAACARRFAAEGASVVCVSRTDENARQTAASISSAGGVATPFCADVCDAQALRAMAAATVAEKGRIDTVVVNAGINERASLLECTPDQWDRIIRVNLTGAFLSVRAVIPGLVEAGGGSIVLIASGAGLSGIRESAAYSAAKGGLVALGRALASELGGYGIRVNSIAPATILTPLIEALYERRVAAGEHVSLADAVSASASMYPLRRLGRTEDCAALALFLASEESAWISGTVVPLDGGLLSTRQLGGKPAA
jgi:NAD(P)-dependent dehydrogenase (short-subunit alcohol dehydrogenase family)